MNTPKHLALQRALGFETPQYAHLPVIFNMSGSKMSKRDKDNAIAKGEAPPEIDVHDFRSAGYLPEALLNFISLLGWSPGDDREQRTLQETVDCFSVDRVGKTNAKFDREKLLAFNTDWSATVSPQRLREAFQDYVQVSGSPIGQAEEAVLGNILDACAGFRTFKDVDNKAGFIFTDDDKIQYNPKAVQKVLSKNDGEGFAVLQRLLPELESATDWNSTVLDALLKDKVQEWQLGFGKIAQPIRVAVSGSTISPQITETLLLLGRDKTLRRIEQTIALRT